MNSIFYKENQKISTNKFTMAVKAIAITALLLLESTLVLLSRNVWRPSYKTLLPEGLYFVFFFVLFYWLIPKGFKIGKKLSAIMLYGAAILLFSLVIIVAGFAMNRTFPNLYSWAAVITMAILVSFHSFLVFMLAFIACILINYSRRMEQTVIETEQRHKVERKLMELEMSRLNTRIDYHFVYNIIASGYMGLWEAAPELAHIYRLLSGLIRYSHQSMATDQKVKLGDEIQQLEQQYQLLSYLYFNARVRFRINVSDNETELLIIPQIFTDLLQNLYKHGELANPAMPGSFEIEILDGYVVSVRTANAMGKPASCLKEGAGIQSLRTRLKYYYPHKHRLTITQEGTLFITELKIEL